ncbi:alpha,alpha-trehalose-phosphate synthase (UDP-forming) [Indioceanicola profundi]|uniref:alpha,alpha-trehalose-phosphate synthase (UDP-forming) n=1 Tax=Indioceanicola profundi TaxID=2220096 RepID=UPI000E6AB19E|nr:trehalose-6-phosphate synthase [Indioceanicola profundi]
MSRLVVVSNRVGLPSSRGGRAGGLEVALTEALQAKGGLWFGWSGQVAEATSTAPKLTTLNDITYATVDLGHSDHRPYYEGYANGALWPIFHYRLDLLRYVREEFDGYLRVNARLAAMLAPLLQPDDVIWVHDYHLIPLASELRRLGVGNRIGFFLHTPLPSPDVLVALPGHAALTEALAAYDLVGFQTRRDLHAFQSYIREEAGGEVTDDGHILAFSRVFRAGAFPIGIDTPTMETLSTEAAESEEARRLRDSLAGRSLIIGVDRLDYSKGLPHRLAAFEHLLATRPEHRGNVTLLQIAPPSRSALAQYKALRRELEQAAGRINGRFAEFDWTPIRYVGRTHRRELLAGFNRTARVGLVTPLRDGMNLVAKEYVASQNPDDPGVLVLSRFAGAAQELTGALRVNPLNMEETADALHRALIMPLAERRARWEVMMEGLRRNTVGAWVDGFLSLLRRPSDQAEQEPLPPPRPPRAAA